MAEETAHLAEQAVGAEGLVQHGRHVRALGRAPPGRARPGEHDHGCGGDRRAAVDVKEAEPAERRQQGVCILYCAAGVGMGERGPPLLSTRTETPTPWGR
jgi:hypothetical protein